LANEVLDAMPVEKFRIADDIQQAYVDINNDQLMWRWLPASTELRDAVVQLDIDFAEGYESEINLWIPGWVNSLSDCLSRGEVLMIDYGFPRREYYHPERSMGTIMCHYQHRAHSDPLIHVGLQDITAHVDFTAVAEAAVAHQFEVAGYTHQAAFLIDCGITDLLSNAKDDIERFNWNNQVKQLTLPSEMGELFKVIALTKDFEQPLIGFQSLDLIERL
ncbi:MAG: SAM-dependent methyltransferase, partial [Coxiellaceae bacterium]|nr:SAM-dependent methyltransferase [Coxiellaceae bacterium]